jgi:hypothetical protein
MKWIKIRVSKYTRALHPDDYQEGLPQPGLDEGEGKYRELIVGNQGGTWMVGRDDVAETWLQENRTYEESKTIVHYANDATQTTKGKKATTKRKQKPLPKQTWRKKSERYRMAQTVQRDGYGCEVCYHDER